MKAKSIIYSRLISLGNYENEKIEIELEIQEGEKASDVFEAAKKFVEANISKSKVLQYEIDNAKKVLADEGIHTLNQIECAKKLLGGLKTSNDLPF